MGTGVCSRRQKSLLHTGLCLLALLGLGSGLFFYNYMLNKASASEAQAARYKQQQETLSAQLQVVYEHRSRLERSLQKEKSEHKKTKEDYLVYKLEAQEALNKEKQDSMNRYGALSSQHKILKNQNEEMKKQLSDLQVEHSNLKLEHRKSDELRNQQLTQLQREKESETAGLQDTILKLREESKLLRRAHQDVHMQLLGAQAQMEEFRQLKDALKRMPSFKDSSTDTQHQQSLADTKKDFKEHKPQVPQNSKGSKNNAEDIPGGHVKKLTQGQPEGQENSLLQSPPVQPASSRLVTRNDSRVSRFTRTVNSLQARRENEDQRVPPHDQELKNEVGHDPPGVMDKKTPTVKVLVANEQVPVHSWQDLVNKVNAKMTEAEKKNGVRNAVTKSDSHPTENRKHGLPQQGNHQMEADVEAEMDAGMIDREETLQSQKQHVGQHTLVPEEVVDPAKDPNNQGEDEFEEAEIDRPEFEEKGEVGKNAVYQKAEQKVLFLQAADAKMKSREEPEEPYQDDQEQDIEEHGGETDNADDLELAHNEGTDKPDAKNIREGYY
ncbi:Golgi integral membrane protein 4-like isoform X2 [Bufo bufo]|uniref:Golgi integral membrane protein 4-like isoform X2 n=1 Tax=Bufo bufo TaxID=8384 RepID=UPI001ABDAEF3|nr:Golgi integral membrane protein 4-like isoform X2 [Bufo bufo]